MVLFSEILAVLSIRDHHANLIPAPGPCTTSVLCGRHQRARVGGGSSAHELHSAASLVGDALRVVAMSRSPCVLIKAAEGALLCLRSTALLKSFCVSLFCFLLTLAPLIWQINEVMGQMYVSISTRKRQQKLSMHSAVRRPHSCLMMNRPAASCRHRSRLRRSKAGPKCC